MTDRPSRLARIVLAACLLAAGLFTEECAAASTTRVDDSGTVVSQGVVPMRWRQLVPGRGADNSVEASVRVALRLNLSRWPNRPIKLYMGLAPSAGEPIHAAWRTQGRLLPGIVRTGTRALIFEGIASGASLEETLELTLRTDGRALVSPQALQFYFEVDTP
jgi:hypothetical protein